MLMLEEVLIKMEEGFILKATLYQDQGTLHFYLVGILDSCTLRDQCLQIMGRFVD